MKLNCIAVNQTEVTTNNGNVVFFSYSTPVAARVDGKLYRTEKRWSVTTSKHIGKWLGSQGGGVVEDKPQEWFDSLT